MAHGITVLICTKNGKDRLPRTLKSLADQNVCNTTWELLLVDNLSSDGTSAVASHIWNTLNRPVPLNILSQPMGGKERAIDLGLSKSESKYVIICDDDNWLAPDYVQTAYDIMSSNHQIGLLGGKGISASAKDLPDWFPQYERYYAIGNQNERNGEIIPTMSVEYIWGAGSVINKQAYNVLIKSGFTRIITTEAYPAFSRNEDLELALAIQLAGYKLWFDDRLVYQHYIPEEKMTWTYLLSLVKPGALVRPFLLIYQGLKVINIDTARNSQLEVYKNHWLTYKRNWIRFALYSNLRPRDVLYNIYVLFRKECVGDHYYFKKLSFWTEFFVVMRFRNKTFDKVFFKLIDLKRNIASYSQGNKIKKDSGVMMV
jgi:glycosyltransferase involved in cell wall biosynthesis